jgi:DNA-binding transcriptional LysR family regulator
MIPGLSIESAYGVRVDVALRQLRALAAVVDEGTFARAASRLGFTQSSISQQVAALERSVGGPVFDRPGGPRGVRLTALGEVVLERGRRVLERADELEDAVERYRAGTGRVDIGTLQSVPTVILPSLVARLHAEHPDCEVRRAEGEAENPSIGELDLLFYDGPLDDDVESVKLLDDPYVLIARPGEFSDEVVRLADVGERATVAWPATCDQPHLERALRLAGAQPRIVFRSASNEALLGMVRAGLGIAFLPELAIAGTVLDDRLRIHLLDPAPVRKIYLHWPRRRTPTPLASRSIALAQEIAAEHRAGQGRSRGS